MKYRQLALRLRRFLDLPAQLPLEWLLSDAPPAADADAALLGALSSARCLLAEVLAAVHTQRDLARMLDRRLDTDRLPTGDSAQETAIRDELLRRGEKHLAEALVSGRPLNRAPARRPCHLLPGVQQMTQPSLPFSTNHLSRCPFHLTQCALRSQGGGTVVGGEVEGRAVTK